MGGSIGVESREGEGSTFWFTAMFDEQPNPPTLPSQERLEGVRILVADDHSTNRTLLTTLLRSWGCAPSEAVDGESAFHELKNAASMGAPYQIALLDMQMPGIDGETLGAYIKADPELAPTQLIMITSLGRRGDGPRLEEIGFAGYLVKPVRQAEVLEMLCLALGRKEGDAKPSKLLTRHTVAESRGKRILVAEDNPTNQFLAVKMLEKARVPGRRGCQRPRGAHSPAKYPLDLVLMDCQMPDMDGFEATRAIRRGDAGHSRMAIPIIAMTATAMQGDRALCLEAGINDYISKPVDLSVLAEGLVRWLTGISGERKEEAPVPTPVEPEVPIFDKAALGDRLMGREDLVDKIVAIFLEDTPRRIEALKEHVADRNAESAYQQAHAIKGAAASVGGEVLRAVAFEMEKAGRSGDMEKVKAIMPHLESGFEQLRQTMRGEVGRP
jgi:CheY-like chemotaxis protein